MNDEAEIKFIENRDKMESYVAAFYQSCQEIGVGDVGFIEDLCEAIESASGKRVELALD